MNTDKYMGATKSRFRRTRIIIQIALLLLPLIFLIWRINLSYSVDAKLKAFKQAGHPTTPAELQQLYYAPIAEESNAAIFFKHAVSLNSFTNAENQKRMDEMWSRGKFLASTQLFSAEYKGKLTQLLTDNQEILNLLHELPPGTTSRYALDFNMGLLMPMPHLQLLPRATHLLSLQAIAHAEQNQMNAAMDDINAAFRVLDSLADEPILITHLVRMKCRTTVYRALERILGRRGFTETQLLELSDAFHKHEYPGSFTRALEGELCFIGDVFQMPTQKLISMAQENDKPAPDQATQKMRGAAGTVLMKWSGFTPRDYNYFLEIMSNGIAATKIPYPERLAIGEQLKRRVEQEPRKYLYIYSGLHLPALNLAYLKEADDIARANIIQTVLAIERYRLTHDSIIPNQLENLIPLIPSLPPDPYTGKPLHYKKLSSGYMLYSIGRNQKDDGGIEYDSKKREGPDDLTFTVER